jgi:uncharacterized membrane protein
METDRDLLSPEEEEAIVPAGDQTRTKQLIAAIGTVLVVVASAIATGQYDVAEIVQSVIGLLTILGVGEIPNRAKG